MSNVAFSMWKGSVVLPVRKLLVPEILMQVARDHDVSVKDLVSPSRYRRIAYARFDAMARLRAVLGVDGKPRFSLPHIGQMLGGRDHTTVLNGLRRWQEISAKLNAVSA